MLNPQPRAEEAKRDIGSSRQPQLFRRTKTRTLIVGICGGGGFCSCCLRRLSRSRAPPLFVGCPRWVPSIAPHDLGLESMRPTQLGTSQSGSQAHWGGKLVPVAMFVQDCFRRKPPTKWQAHAHGSIVRMGLIEAQFLVPCSLQYLVPSRVHVSFVAVCRYGRQN
jgi:hypothetical protein